MADPVSGPVGENTKHYLDALEHFKDEPEYSYRYHHWVVSAQLHGPIDADKIKDAFDTVIGCSPVLRSYFGKEDGEWKHIILPSLKEDYFTHRKHAAHVDWRTEIGKLTQELNEQVLSVDRAPLFKILLQEFGDTAIITMHIHHLILDGWGLVVLYHQVVQSYDSALNGNPSPVPILDPNDFLTIALRDENKWADAGDRQSKLDWWASHIGDHRYMKDPVPEPPAYLDVCLGGLTHETSNAVLAYAEAEDVHFSYVVRAAYVKALQDWTGDDDVLMTSVKANRSKASGQVVANLAHWAITRHNTPRDMPLQEMAKVVMADTNVSKDQYLPYWDIVKALSPDQYFSNCGVTPFSFNYLPPVDGAIESGGEVSLVPLFEFIAFSPRLMANKFYPRCLMSVDPATGKPVIGIDVGFNREIVDAHKAQAVLDQITQEITTAFS